MSDKNNSLVDMMEREKFLVSMDTLPKAEERLFEGIARIYFHIIANNPFFVNSVREIGEVVDVEPKNLKDALNIFMKVKQKYNRIKNDKIVIKEGVMEVGFNPNTDEISSLKNSSEKVLDQAIEFVSTANTVQDLQYDNLDEYYNVLFQKIKDLQSIMSKTRFELSDLPMFNSMFQIAYKAFSLSVKSTREILSDYKDKQQKKSDTSVVESRVVKFEIQKTQREILIEKARAKYQMFCDDFMRDLNNQYALSSRDLYENFINVTFKRFCNKYLPIKDSIKEERAKEIIFAIDELIEEITNISSNSYVTSVYSQKQ